FCFVRNSGRNGASPAEVRCVQRGRFEESMVGIRLGRFRVNRNPHGGAEGSTIRSMRVTNSRPVTGQIQAQLFNSLPSRGDAMDLLDTISGSLMEGFFP